MANTRRSPSGAQKPQLDYYEYKRQREERLRRRAEAEGRVWQPPVDPRSEEIEQAAEEFAPETEAEAAAQEEIVQEEEQAQENAVMGALGKIGSWGAKLKNAVTRPRNEEYEEEYADEEYSDEYAEEYAEAEEAGEEQFEEELTEEAADQPAEEKVFAEEEAPAHDVIAEEESTAWEEAADIEPAELPAQDETGAQEPGEEYAEEEYADEESSEEYADEEYAEEYADEAYAEDETDGNEDNPFAAFLRVAKKAGGQAAGFFGGLKSRFGKQQAEEEYDEAAEYSEEEAQDEEWIAGEEAQEPFETDENAVFAVENAEPEEAVSFEEEDAAEAEEAGEIAAEEPADAMEETEEDAQADIAEDAGEAQDLFLGGEDEWDGEEEEPEEKQSFGAKLKGFFASLKFGRREEPGADDPGLRYGCLKLCKPNPELRLCCIKTSQRQAP